MRLPSEATASVQRCWLQGQAKHARMMRPHRQGKKKCCFPRSYVHVCGSVRNYLASSRLLTWQRRVHMRARKPKIRPCLHALCIPTYPQTHTCLQTEACPDSVSFFCAVKLCVPSAGFLWHSIFQRLHLGDRCAPQRCF